MTLPRCSVRGILNEALLSSRLNPQVLHPGQRIDSSDDYLALTTFLRPAYAGHFDVIDYVNEDESVGVRTYLLRENAVISSYTHFNIASSVRRFGNMRRQCILFSREYEYESPFGTAPNLRDATTVGFTFYPSRASIRLALDPNRRMNDIDMQLFGIRNINRQTLEEVDNIRYEVLDSTGNMTLSLAYW